MATFRFHLIGGHPVNVDMDARSIVELGEMITTERFIIGKRAEPDEDGVLPGILIATSRIQCVVEAG